MNLRSQINLKTVPRISEPVSITIYRIIQECLTNISRHAKAKNVEIEINYIKKNTSMAFIHIYVKDDGVGFNKSHIDGFGLSGMRERVHASKGRIKFESHAHQGVTLNIQLPIVHTRKK